MHLQTAFIPLDIQLACVKRGGGGEEQRNVAMLGLE